MVRDVRHLGTDLRNRLETIEREVERERLDLRRKTANVAKDEQLEQMRQDVGTDLRLGRVRSGRGAAIGVRYTITADEVLVAARGPVPLVANPIPAHDIPRVGGRGKKKRLILRDGGFRTTVSHPGTEGKDTWNQGVERARPRVSTVIGRDMDAAVRRSFNKGG